MDGACLTEDEVLALVEGTLSAEEAAAAHEHIGRCSECRTVVAAAGGATVSESSHPTEPRRVDDAGPSDASPAFARGATVGRYVILDLIGAGNMGVVYAAYDPELDRKIALKLLHVGALWGAPSTDDLRKRLLREARAMARVSHPNVVAVYDAGIAGARVFVAMEFVEGTTLNRWVREKPRSWREILAVYAAAGHGLAAAHAAGLVHRDFKPENVLIGADGRVCVGDFGLARAEAQEVSSSGAEPMRSAGSGEGVVTRLTRTGALVGTPAYMAPEQLRGEKADARADQFSFAVALYEALSGSRPYTGDSLEEMSKAMQEGAFRARTTAWSVPARVQRALARALKVHPRERYPSMVALLADLERHPAIWRGAALIFAVAAVSLGIVAYARHGAGPSCAGGEEKLAGIWDAQRQQAIRSAFAATGKPYATDVWKGVQRTLDAYTQRWVAMHREACEATRREEQSEHLRDLRMQCLSERRARLKALTDVLAHADDKVLSNAVQAGYALADLSGCADARALTTGIPAPAESIRPKAQVLAERLAQASARLDAGKYADGLRIANAVLEEARPLGYRPLDAEARWLKGELLQRTGDLRAAEATLLEAVHAADAARKDELGAEARISLVQVVGIDRSKPAEGHQWARFAGAAIERLGGDARLRAKLQARLALLLRQEGRFTEAIAQGENAISLMREVLGPEHPDIAAALNSLGVIFDDRGSFEDALRCYERALSIGVKVLGPMHPWQGRPLNNIGAVFLERGQPEKALPFFRRALAIWEKALDAHHFYVASAHGNIGAALRLLGRPREAIAEHKLALATLEATLGREHPMLANSVQNIGIVFFRDRQYEQARQYFQRALEIRERALGKDNPEVALSLIAMATLYERTKQFAKALSVARRTLAITEKARDPRHPLLTEALTEIGLAHLGQGAPAAAVAPLERALSLRDPAKTSPLNLAGTKFGLARALWETRRDRPRSLELAKEAAALLAKSREASAADRAEVRSWLSQRARGR
jgi:tetratricopeptide (TPR) repeat protein